MLGGDIEATVANLSDENFLSFLKAVADHTAPSVDNKKEIAKINGADGRTDRNGTSDPQNNFAASSNVEHADDDDASSQAWLISQMRKKADAERQRDDELFADCNYENVMFDAKKLTKSSSHDSYKLFMCNKVLKESSPVQVDATVKFPFFKNNLSNLYHKCERSRSENETGASSRFDNSNTIVEVPSHDEEMMAPEHFGAKTSLANYDLVDEEFRSRFMRNNRHSTSRDDDSVEMAQSEDLRKRAEVYRNTSSLLSDCKEPKRRSTSQRSGVQRRSSDNTHAPVFVSDFNEFQSGTPTARSLNDYGPHNFSGNKNYLNSPPGRRNLTSGSQKPLKSKKKVEEPKILSNEINGYRGTESLEILLKYIGCDDAESVNDDTNNNNGNNAIVTTGTSNGAKKSRPKKDGKKVKAKKASSIGTSCDTADVEDDLMMQDRARSTLENMKFLCKSDELTSNSANADQQQQSATAVAAFDFRKSGQDAATVAKTRPASEKQECKAEGNATRVGTRVTQFGNRKPSPPPTRSKSRSPSGRSRSSGDKNNCNANDDTSFITVTRKVKKTTRYSGGNATSAANYRPVAKRSITPPARHQRHHHAAANSGSASVGSYVASSTNQNRPGALWPSRATTGPPMSSQSVQRRRRRNSFDASPVNYDELKYPNAYAQPKQQPIAPVVVMRPAPNGNAAMPTTVAANRNSFTGDVTAPKVDASNAAMPTTGVANRNSFTGDVTASKVDVAKKETSPPAVVAGNKVDATTQKNEVIFATVNPQQDLSNALSNCGGLNTKSKETVTELTLLTSSVMKADVGVQADPSQIDQSMMSSTVGSTVVELEPQGNITPALVSPPAKNVHVVNAITSPINLQQKLEKVLADAAPPDGTRSTKPSYANIAGSRQRRRPTTPTKLRASSISADHFTSKPKLDPGLKEMVNFVNKGWSEFVGSSTNIEWYEK